MRKVSDTQTVVAVNPTRRMRRPRFDEEDRQEPAEPQERRPPSAPPAHGAEEDPPPAGTHVDEFA